MRCLAHAYGVKLMSYSLRQRLESDQPSWSMDRRTILQSAGALIGASAFFSARRTFAQDAGPSNVRISPWHKGQVGFMLAHEQFTVPQLVELGAAAEQAGFDFIAT